MLLTRRGESLVELIVALLILELVGAASLATALAVERLTRRAARAEATDAQRLATYRARETDSACVRDTLADTAHLAFAATPDRPALELAVRCGR